MNEMLPIPQPWHVPWRHAAERGEKRRSEFAWEQRAGKSGGKTGIQMGWRRRGIEGLSDSE
jgi:hypothetical protein